MVNKVIDLLLCILFGFKTAAESEMGLSQPFLVLFTSGMGSH